ncbi:hypothetical protein [Brevundimonas sp. GCM10030266]|uniref:hypothetical protein n=1 Tax=Brevundimonas sp. GCM10030266 TaxID=3273386 RepID=UPI00361518EF
MFGWFERRKPTADATIGVPPYDWQPKRMVAVTYALAGRDEAEWQAFSARAEAKADFRPLKDFEPLQGEPARAGLDPDVRWWARVGDELWFLADRDWFDWPDPQQYALLVGNRTGKKLMQFGNFGVLPAAWTLPASELAERSVG